MRDRKLLGRVRTSTVVLLVGFVGLFVLWLQVRPANQRPDVQSTSDITDAPPLRHRPVPRRTPHASPTALPTTAAPDPAVSPLATAPDVVAPSAGTSTPRPAASHSPTPRPTSPAALLP